MPQGVSAGAATGARSAGSIVSVSISIGGRGTAAGRARIIGIADFPDRIGLQPRCRAAEHVAGADREEQAHAQQQAPRRVRPPAEQREADRHAGAGECLALA
ncbi:hypothetical protein G6F54_014204 [Rhizopus delemar]|nr:hypothetical protein G6F54_014204 [Rhizopus delemar]